MQSHFHFAAKRQNSRDTTKEKKIRNKKVKKNSQDARQLSLLRTTDGNMHCFVFSHLHMPGTRSQRPQK
jgi:hypothetical protein